MVVGGTRVSFRTLLLITTAIGLLALAFTSSLATAWVTSQRTRDLLLAQGTQITGSLARQSVLALLYQSGDNAQEAVRATLAFPDVRYVALLDQRGQILYQRGSGPAAVPTAWELAETSISDGPLLIREDGEAWHFVAPVYTHSGEDGAVPAYAMDQPTPGELLGHVYVVVAKSGLHSIQAKVFTNNILISFGVALLLLLASQSLLNRLTRPLSALAGVMQEAANGRVTTRARPCGPREVATIADIFNAMMDALEASHDALRQHNELLESEVALRTRELVAARDVAIAANRHKSEFLANVTHELRTPLQAIIGYTDVVQEALEDEGLEEYAGDLERVLNRAQHLLSLINDVLDLAKIEAGRMELHLEQVNLRRLLQEAEEGIKPLIQKNGNHLTVVLEQEQELLEIDPGRLLQILFNLLSNAAKFTDHGEVGLHATLSHERLELKIEDSGIGIAPEYQRAIFDEFRQVDGSDARYYSGTGLGLSITRRLCQLMGGDVAVASTPGQGTCFTVTIPLPIELVGPERGTTKESALAEV